MTSDRTQQQSTEARERSQGLSQQRTAPPVDIPGYDARQFIGAGAYGEVWVALDQNTGRRVAIKFFMHRGGLDWSQLSGEVEKLVFLSADRYVVQLLDVGWDSDPAYYVMEYVENGSLEDRLNRTGPLTVGEAVEIFREVAVGLSRAHGKGVLHCDLKPANILLDQDNKPRLADFGQSRLSYEQTPALGTLFFMAPEQADLQAVPDARWDVYALGALLYTMLVGQPPHGSDTALDKLDSTSDLADRLASYRELIESTPLTYDRKLRGVDRSLQLIIDRCLAVDPEQRYPNVQSVLNALKTRDQARDRRPLVMLGLVGPLLFLVISTWFAWGSYQHAVGDADTLLLQRAQESNGFAADFAAEAVARRIESYFRAVEELANSRDFQQEFNDTLRETDDLLVQLDGRPTQERSATRQAFHDHPVRQPLQKRMNQLVARPDRRDIASWFTTDHRGIHLASAFDTKTDNSPVGGDFSYRTYFHGGPQDLASENGAHIERTHVSTVFRSEATGVWKVAISTPIFQDDRFTGIVALTVELGRLGELVGNKGNPRQFNVLVDGRPGENRGVVLQHPLLEKLRDADPVLDLEFSTSADYRAPLDRLEESSLYQDPMGQHPQGEEFRRNWIAAQRPVLLGSDATSPARQTDTGLVVIVQEDYDLASRAVHQLGAALFRQEITALATIVVLLIVLWCAVARALADPDERVRRRGGTRPSPSTIHSMETIELPRRLRR